MGFQQVAVIGTDCISASIALALKAQPNPPKITGYDVDPARANQALGMGAFDRTERKPERACRKADLVIVAVPLPVIAEAFAAIAPQLQPDCLVTDIAHLKAPVMRWAAQLLPKSVYFVGGHPLLNPAAAGHQPPPGLEAASDHLLKGALYCLTTPPGIPSTVVDAFTGLALSLEATPFFVDVTEHDGLQAGAEGLPDLLAIALLRATVDTPGWQEMRKFAGYRFATATAAAADAHERQSSVFLNREHVLRRLNILLGELVRLRDLLSRDDAEALEKDFVAAAEGRTHLLKEQAEGMWLKERITNMENVPTAGERVGQIIFGGYTTDRIKGGAGRSSRK